MKKTTMYVRLPLTSTPDVAEQHFSKSRIRIGFCTWSNIYSQCSIRV